MFLASKIAWASMVFLLLATGISGLPPTRATSGLNLSKDVPAVRHLRDINRMQQTLLDRGYYRGNVDGVFGLRTRAGIRAYQKAEGLSVTGQLDKDTAGRLGVASQAREQTRFNTTQEKPPAGTKWAKGAKRARKAPKTPVQE